MATNINCFQLMNNACKKLKGNFWRSVLASLVVIAPLVAVAFIPYAGLIISLFFSGYLFYGLIVYYKKLFAEENPSLKVIFTNWNKFGVATLVGILNVVALLIGAILLLVPAIVYMMYYSVNMQLLTDKEDPKVNELFVENQERMYTNKTLALSYKVLCYFMFIFVLGLAALAFMPVVSMSLTNHALAVFLGLLIVIGIIAGFTFINVLYQATQLEFYNACLPSVELAKEYVRLRNEKIIAKKKAKEAKATEEIAPVIEEKVEEEKVVEVKKTTTRKTSTKKTEEKKD